MVMPCGLAGVAEWMVKSFIRQDGSLGEEQV